MTPPTAPIHRAQTLKQAKAAYKSRNQTTLTEREKRQIERSVELDRRAWRAKEMEKRKAEARARREEKERQQKPDGPCGMTSQRRMDRFGFVASQMHLVAFFGGGKKVEKTQEGVMWRGPGDEDEEFGGGLDDESMLDALGGDGAETPTRAQAVTAQATLPAATANRPKPGQTKAASRLLADDVESFFDDLESSTQIARDLATETTVPAGPKSNSSGASYSFEDFDLSVEDIEAAHTKEIPNTNPMRDKQLMPPPVLPIKPVSSRSPQPPQKPQIELVPAPSHLRAGKKPSTVWRTPQVGRRNSTTVSLKSLSTSAGFTLAELESFVDDDLQLSQVEPV